MLNNRLKKPFIEEMNENLEQMSYVFSDIGQASIKLNAKLKTYEDEESLLWLQKFENKLFEVKEKIGQMNLAFKPLLGDYISTVNNCLMVEIKRIYYMKNLLAKNQMYEYIAQLRDIEKGIEQLTSLMKLKT